MWLTLSVLVAVGFGLGAWLGAPYVPVRTADLSSILDLANLKRGQTLLDLGCGDGRLLAAAAKRGIKCYGYEINPLLAFIAWLRTAQYRNMVQIRLANYWRADWPEVEAIFIFGITRYIPKFDQQFQSRLKTPVKVISYVYEFPDRQAVRSTKNAWLYHYPILSQ